MNVMTFNDLASRNDIDLTALFHKVAATLAVAKPGTPDRQSAIATLQNINAVQRARQAQRYVRHLKPAAPGL